MTSESNDVPGFGSKSMIYNTPRGKVTIRSNCRKEFIENLRLDSGLGRFATYSSIIQKIESFESIVNQEGGKVTLAIVEPDLIVGYNVCWYPGSDERWSLLNNLMYEMAAVEVSRNYRGLKLASRLLELTVDGDWFESKIAYMNGYSWHWDLEGAGLTPVQYRKMMMELYSPHGFREVYTNEPNIALRAENIMMIRVGAKVTAEDKLRFRYLRFGMLESLKKGI